MFGLFNVVPTLEMGMQSFPGALGEDPNCTCWEPVGEYNYLGVELRFGDRPVESSSFFFFL